MSEIAKLLRTQSEDIANELKAVADQQEFLEMTKQAAVETLIEQGIDAEKASELVKSAKEIQNLAVSQPVFNMDVISEVFEKSASYIEELEVRLAEMQSKIESNEEMLKQASLSGNPKVAELRGLGFSEEEIKMLGNSGMIEKVAQTAGQPWESGSVSSRPGVAAMDPIERFCLGG